MNKRSDFKFHLSTNAIGNGNELKINDGWDSVLVSIKTTGTFEAKFQMYCVSTDDWRDVVGANLKTLDMSSTVTDGTVRYSVGISGEDKMRVVLISNTGITTVCGRVVIL